MSDIIYPTIDLFVYDLQSSLNATEEENHERKVYFQSKLPENTQLVDSDIEIECLELLPNQKIADFTNKNKNLEGYYYPVRFNDTYGLQIDCSINNLTEPQPVDSFAIIKAEIEATLQEKSATIGQTWMLSGCLPENSQKSSQEIAKFCYTLFLENANFEQDLQERQGYLFEGEIFELSQYKPSQDINLHIIIVIYPNLQSMEKAANLYSDWLGLFSYKHKILFAYTQSRLIKKNLVKYYKKIEENKKNIDKNKKLNADKKIEAVEDILENYTINLPKLNFQKQILDINLINYKTRLEIIKNKTLESDNLEFLNKFSNLSEEKYRVQIEKDYENMELALRLLESNINIIRSQIEAEKSKRDRNFQNLVTLVGTGTAIMALIDDEGKKCQAITEVVPSTFIKQVCDNSFGKIIAFPIITILILGSIGLLMKAILAKIELRR
ncbi:MAG: hypothetical protein QNJ42_07020 [Crocosphaera sp.]|nr:hypothetical protein [Crocosphaera sp.]